MHLKPWQFWRSRKGKKKHETEGPAQGKEMNEPYQWNATNSPSRRDNYPWLRLIRLTLLWVCLHFPLKCVLSFSINHFRFSASVSLLNSLLRGYKNPVTAALGWILPWTSPWTSCNIITYKELQRSLYGQFSINKVYRKMLQIICEGCKNNWMENSTMLICKQNLAILWSWK